MKNFTVLFLLLNLLACATPRTVPAPAPSPVESPVTSTPYGPIPEIQGPPEPMGPQPIAEASPLPSVSPSPGAPADRIVVVLGPGFVHGFAAAGVFKALHELKIPIDSIYASETGALISALYLTQSTLNRLDWSLLHFPDRIFSGTENDALAKKLHSAFQDQRVEGLRIPLHIVVRDEVKHTFTLKSNGLLWEQIAAAMITAGGSTHARSTHGYFVDEALSTTRFPVVVFTTTALSEQERGSFAKAALVVPIDLRTVDDHNLKRKNDAQYAGKRAVLAERVALLGLVGMKVDTTDENTVENTVEE